MYEHKMFKITREWLHANSTSPCGNSFCRAQLALLGVEWPPQKGWTAQVIGYEIPLDMKLEFESYKGTGKPKKNRTPVYHKPAVCPFCGQGIPKDTDHHRPLGLNSTSEEPSFLTPSDEQFPPW